MSVEALISTQVIDTTSVGRSIMTAADAAAVRTAADAQVTLVSGTNIKTVNSTSLLGPGDIAVGVSGTGAVDNAALRADGTGGATLQSSAFVIADNATASPNNTVNHASIQATGDTTNVSVSIKPKGSGSFTLSTPDGTATGGNVRGAYVVDLQLSRSTSAQVASADYSTISGGRRNTIGASASDGAIGGGYLNTLSGFAYNSFIGCGNENTVSAGYSFIGSGVLNSVSADYASISCGRGGSATRYGQEAYASGFFAAVGDAQTVRFRARNKTTNTTPTTLFLDGSSSRLTIPAGKVMSFTARITGIKSDGTAVAEYVRKGVIKRIVNTTSLVGSIETIGTDIEDNALTDVAITADDTNEALQISVTGITGETWRWVAVVEGLEIAYGT